MTSAGMRAVAGGWGWVGGLSARIGRRRFFCAMLLLRGRRILGEVPHGTLQA